MPSQPSNIDSSVNGRDTHSPPRQTDDPTDFSAGPVRNLLPSDWGTRRLRRFGSVLPGMLYEYVMTSEGRRELLFVGSKCRELLELNESDLLANPMLFAELVFEEDLQRLMAADEAANKEGVAFAADARIRTKSGQTKWIHMASRPNAPTAGGLVVWNGFMFDITERKQLEEQIRHMAFYDALTDLPNRRLLNDRLRQAISASDRSGVYGAIFVLDLDNFKTLNDTQGHLVGDALLVEAAARLRNSVRAMDTVGRFGGDEFVVMLSELSADEEAAKWQATQVAEKVRVTLAEPFMLAVPLSGQAEQPMEHHCTASIGAVLFRGKAVAQDMLFKNADAAMYVAKRSGRNQVRFFGS